MTSTTSRIEQRVLFTGLTKTDLTMLLVVLIWGANFSIVKAALTEIPPLAFATLRFVSASVLLLAFTFWREGRRALPPDRATFWKLTWIGFIGNTVYQALFTYSLTLTTAANGSLIIATTPAWVALTAAVLGIERVRRTMAMGIALAIGGVMLVVAERGLSLGGSGLLGDLLMLGAALCWMMYTLGVRTLGQGLSPLAITAWTMVTGVPGMALISIPDWGRVAWDSVSFNAWFGLLYATLLALVLAYVLWNNSVRVAGSARTAIYSCAIPLVATLLAWPLIGEQPTWVQGIGGLLIISGVLLTRRP
ncbi:MAG: EamA family transporter [Chloroflexus aggregans]|uniref:EamA family transporter n=1 Tax=Chloroflexus aggregans TaxID=152260 RepID=A0A2J6WY34_9CHLR|nr:MAG: EamA family transporter [Chloroflexus aggregans]